MSPLVLGCRCTLPRSWSRHRPRSCILPPWWWPPLRWCMGPHRSWSEAIMARAIALGDIITTTGAVGDSGAGARIPAAESRAAGASTPAALTRLAVPILSVPPWRTTCSALWLSSLQIQLSQGPGGVAGVIGSFFTVVEVATIILFGHGSSSFLSALKSMRVYSLIAQGFWPLSLRRQRRGADSHRIHPARY